MTKAEWRKLLYLHAVKVSKAKTVEEINAANRAAAQVERMAALAGVNVEQVLEEAIQDATTPPRAPTDALTERQTKVMMRQQAAENRMTVMRLLSEGKPPILISKLTGLDDRTVDRYINEGTASILQHFHNPRLPATYARYATFYLEAIDQLGQAVQDIKRDRNPRKQWQALVSAVKTRTELYDKLLERGMEYGIINTDQQRTDLGGNVEDMKARLDENIKVLTILRKEMDRDPGFTARHRDTGPKRDTRVRKVKKVKQDLLGIMNVTDRWKYPQNVLDTRQDAIDLEGPESPMGEHDRILQIEETRRSLEIAIKRTPPHLTAREKNPPQDSTVIDAEYSESTQDSDTPVQYLVPPKR